MEQECIESAYFWILSVEILELLSMSSDSKLSIYLILHQRLYNSFIVVILDLYQ